LLTPFPGEQKNEPKNSTYNFFLSQLHIIIEMAFGLLVNIWRIFKHPLQVKLKNVGKVFICATILHSFCIYEGDNDNNNNVGMKDFDGMSLFIPSDNATKLSLLLLMSMFFRTSIFFILTPRIFHLNEPYFLLCTIGLDLRSSNFLFCHNDITLSSLHLLTTTMLSPSTDEGDVLSIYLGWHSTHYAK
jgi:DDE superfamily endonuclease